MSEANQRRLIMLFCFRCDVTEMSQVTSHDDEVAFQLRISDEEWRVTKELFIAKGFITEDNEIVNWDKRQFISDSSKNRTQAYRARIKQAKSNACNNISSSKKGVTSQKRHSDAIDTDTDSDSDSDAEINIGDKSPQDFSQKKSHQNFKPPSLSEVCELIANEKLIAEGSAFVNFYESKGWMIGKSKMKDWKAALRGWSSRNKTQQSQTTPGATPSTGQGAYVKKPPKHEFYVPEEWLNDDAIDSTSVRIDNEPQLPGWM